MTKRRTRHRRTTVVVPEIVLGSSTRAVPIGRKFRPTSQSPGNGRARKNDLDDTRVIVSRP